MVGLLPLGCALNSQPAAGGRMGEHVVTTRGQLFFHSSRPDSCWNCA